MFAILLTLLKLTKCSNLQKYLRLRVHHECDPKEDYFITTESALSFILECAHYSPKIIDAENPEKAMDDLKFEYIRIEIELFKSLFEHCEIYKEYSSADYKKTGNLVSHGKSVRTKLEEFKLAFSKFQPKMFDGEQVTWNVDNMAVEMCKREIERAVTIVEGSMNDERLKVAIQSMLLIYNHRLSEHLNALTFSKRTAFYDKVNDDIKMLEKFKTNYGEFNMTGISINDIMEKLRKIKMNEKEATAKAPSRSGLQCLQDGVRAFASNIFGGFYNPGDS